MNRDVFQKQYDFELEQRFDVVAKEYMADEEREKNRIANDDRKQKELTPKSLYFTSPFTSPSLISHFVKALISENPVTHA